MPPASGAVPLPVRSSTKPRLQWRLGGGAGRWQQKRSSSGRQHLQRSSAERSMREGPRLWTRRSAHCRRRWTPCGERSRALLIGCRWRWRPWCRAVHDRPVHPGRLRTAGCRDAQSWTRSRSPRAIPTASRPEWEHGCGGWTRRSGQVRTEARPSMRAAWPRRPRQRHSSFRRSSGGTGQRSPPAPRRLHRRRRAGAEARWRRSCSSSTAGLRSAERGAGPWSGGRPCWSGSSSARGLAAQVQRGHRPAPWPRSSGPCGRTKRGWPLRCSVWTA
mmetsp:Transcript_6642/g.20571  ORF Transcript_6642/g.20571 Transcript_6642/m.20571 type:complete len:274 (+) Transcript_6642:500-1321(+)